MLHLYSKPARAVLRSTIEDAALTVRRLYSGHKSAKLASIPRAMSDCASPALSRPAVPDLLPLSQQKILPAFAGPRRRQKMCKLVMLKEFSAS
jgi:hypothetical protein